MSGIHFKSWLTVRHRKSIALAVAGWMSLSLVLVFWPCCHTVADEHSPVVSHGTGGHDHGGMPHGTEDPCRTWLNSSNVALNTTPDILLSNIELKAGHAAYAVTHDFPVVAPSVPGRHRYHPSPPVPLPLYLRIHHLLI